MKTYQILSDFLKVDEMDHVLLSPQNQDAASPHAQMPDPRPSPPEEDSVCVRFPFQRKLIVPRGLTAIIVRSHVLSIFTQQC